MFTPNTEIMTRSGGAVAQQPIAGDLFQRWISYVDAAPKTVQTYSRAIKRFYAYTAEQGITQPTRADVIAYRDRIAAECKPTTVQGYMAAVKLFFRWTAQEGIYPNIADRVKGPRLDSEHKKDYLTTRQAGQLMQDIDRSTLKGKRDYAILAVMITTGLRTISIVTADISDIRTAGDSAALYYQGKGHTEKAIYVKLADPVEAALRDYLKARGPAAANDPLFASMANRNGGERMTTRSVSRIAKDHLVNAGLNSDRLTAHSLRHTAATLNLLNGGTVEETKQLLNHSNLNTTLIYSHALDREKNNSENRISSAVFGS